MIVFLDGVGHSQIFGYCSTCFENFSTSKAVVNRVVARVCAVVDQDYKVACRTIGGCVLVATVVEDGGDGGGRA